MRITLDAETFKALASPTRLTVLRALDERRKTLTEISRDLSLNKATVHEHLALLTGADLVRKRDDEGRKWIYYELTWRGQKLLHPQETTTFNVLLGMGIAAAGGGLGLLANALLQAANQTLPALQSNPEAADTGATTAFSDQKNASPAASSASTTASSTETSTASSTGTSATGSSSASPSSAGAGAPAAPVADTAADQHLVRAADSPSTGASTHHLNFFDEGGAIAIALLAAGLLFWLLSWLLRRRFRPGKFVPPTQPETP